MELKIFKLHKTVPDTKYGSSNAACFDISAFIQFQSSVIAYTKNNGLVEILSSIDAENKSYIDIPSEWRVLIPTGMIFDISENHSVKIYPRSGISTRIGLNLINCVGIIDSDYVEEVFIPIYNNSQQKLRLFSGDRIAQAELVQNNKLLFQYINERPEKKGDRCGGFGSTGI